MIAIRSFRAEDAPSVAGILRDCNINVPDVQTLELHLRAAKTLVAEQNGTPVGFACLSVSFGCTACVTAELTHLCVLPQHRGMGIGRALLTGLENFAAANAVSSVRASIPESTAPFFGRLGYTVSAAAAVKRI